MVPQVSSIGLIRQRVDETSRTSVLYFGLAGLLGEAVVVSSLLEQTVSSTTTAREARYWEVTVTTGTIKKVVAERGFGFITAEDAKEYFFHRSGLEPSIEFDRLLGGERVSFDVESGPKGARAVRVRAA